GNASVGDKTIDGNPFTPGVREQYEVTHGTFMPVYLSSESGRAAFVPINRGVDFFDRHAHATESNAISPTTWNEYSVGALQCAMRLDVTAVTSATNPTPTSLRFEYRTGSGGNRGTVSIRYPAAPGYTTKNAPAPLEPGFTRVASENGSYTFNELV